MKLRLYDTETTALNGEIVEVAYTDISDGTYTAPVSSLIKPNGPIMFGAMATHLITDEMVSGAPVWTDVQSLYLPDGDMYVGSHNWKFDKKMLGEGFQNNKSICTLELVRRLIPKSELDSYSNLAVYFYLELHKKFDWPHGGAHRAAYDVEITARVLIELMERFDKTLDDCYNLLNGFNCTFKKHYGKLWADVVKEDVDYVRWLLDNGKVWDDEVKDRLSKMMEEY